MIDAHVHLEKGDYSVEWIEQFIAYAVRRNIDEIFFLEHCITIIQSLSMMGNMNHGPA